jgi:uncharacterized protein (TIGR03435 family)
MKRIVFKFAFRRALLAAAGILAASAPFIAGLANAQSEAALAQAMPTSPAARPAAWPEFEVASVKPSVERPPTAGRGGGCPESFKMDRGRIDFECVPLRTLIGYAFGIPRRRVMGPDWMVDRRAPAFDIHAKLPLGASQNQIPEMLQALLADRFKLAIHRGNKEDEVYALVVAKAGLKVKEAAPEADDTALPAAADPGGRNTITRSSPSMGTVRQTEGPDKTFHWDAPNTTFEGLADLIDPVGLLSPVIDMTGLKGRYQVVLEISLNDAFAAAAALMEQRGGRPAAGGVSGIPADPIATEDAQMDMQKAILKGLNSGLLKLGLQLERRRGPVETLVVDRVEKTPAGN